MTVPPSKGRREKIERAGSNESPLFQGGIFRRGNMMDIIVSLETLAHDVRYALRSLYKSPGFTAVVILILALGIGANTAVFTVVNGVLLRPLPFPDPARLFLISYGPREGPFGARFGLADYHYLEFRRQNQLFEYIASFSFHPVTLTGAGDPVRVPGAIVTPDFSRVLRVYPAAGRTFLPEEDQQGRNQAGLLSDKL